MSCYFLGKFLQELSNAKSGVYSKKHVNSSSKTIENRLARYSNWTIYQILLIHFVHHYSCPTESRTFFLCELFESFWDWIRFGVFITKLCTFLDLQVNRFNVNYSHQQSPVAQCWIGNSLLQSFYRMFLLVVLTVLWQVCGIDLVIQVNGFVVGI